ncbi:unnamed protein product, partial [Thelazia callipaeda]|uniref:Ovule protein n=1 Tax=Thelazia callipaeda TaxID=103827 RepID=A0A0N5CTP7_THECL
STVRAIVPHPYFLDFFRVESNTGFIPFSSPLRPYFPQNRKTLFPGSCPSRRTNRQRNANQHRLRSELERYPTASTSDFN